MVVSQQAIHGNLGRYWSRENDTKVSNYSYLKYSRFFLFSCNSKLFEFIFRFLNQTSLSKKKRKGKSFEVLCVQTHPLTKTLKESRGSVAQSRRATHVLAKAGCLRAHSSHIAYAAHSCPSEHTHRCPSVKAHARQTAMHFPGRFLTSA